MLTNVNSSLIKYFLRTWTKAESCSWRVLLRSCFFLNPLNLKIKPEQEKLLLRLLVASASLKAKEAGFATHIIIYACFFVGGCGVVCFCVVVVVVFGGGWEGGGLCVFWGGGGWGELSLEWHRGENQLDQRRGGKKLRIKVQAKKLH